VRFGQTGNALQFAESHLTGPAPGANQVVADQMRNAAGAVLARVAPPSLQAEVADALRRLLASGGSLDRATVAKRLGMSVRTLHRRLEHESASFQALCDSVRRELARALLTDPIIKVEVVARSVGFAEVASFSRAFTRWTGCSPTRFRAQYAQGRLSGRASSGG
jgi:AraC-like DNA-binding protein